MSDQIDDLAPPVSAEEAAAAAALDAQIDTQGDYRPPGEPQAKDDPKPQEPQPASTGDAEPPRDFEAEARQMGWTTKDEWEAAGKDPEKHRDAKTFVELADNDPAVLRQRFHEERKKNEDFQKRITAATKAQVERVRKESEEHHRQEVDRLRQERDQLIEQHKGDPNAIRQVNDQYEKAREQVAQPMAPEIAEWFANHPEFDTDAGFRALALAKGEEVKTMPFAEQVKEMDDYLSKRFPEYYGTAPQVQPQTKPPNGAPPADSRSMEGVRRTAPPKNGFDSLPAEARAMYQTLKDDLGKDAPTKEAFAKDYHDG